MTKREKKAYLESIAEALQDRQVEREVHKALQDACVYGNGKVKLIWQDRLVATDPEPQTIQVSHVPVDFEDEEE